MLTHLAKNRNIRSIWKITRNILSKTQTHTTLRQNKSEHKSKKMTFESTFNLTPYKSCHGTFPWACILFCIHRHFYQRNLKDKRSSKDSS